MRNYRSHLLSDALLVKILGKVWREKENLDCCCCSKKKREERTDQMMSDRGEVEKMHDAQRSLQGGFGGQYTPPVAIKYGVAGSVTSCCPCPTAVITNLTFRISQPMSLVLSHPKSGHSDWQSLAAGGFRTQSTECLAITIHNHDKVSAVSLKCLTLSD